VTVKNEPGGAITDVDGHFYIEVPNKQSVLNITYIGFKSKEIVVGNENQLQYYTRRRMQKLWMRLW